MNKSENTKYANPAEMFTDVYSEQSELLKKQLVEFKQHITSNKEHYPLNSYEKF